MIRRLLLYLLPKNQIANGSNKCKSSLVNNNNIFTMLALVMILTLFCTFVIGKLHGWEGKIFSPDTRVLNTDLPQSRYTTWSKSAVVDQFGYLRTSRGISRVQGVRDIARTGDQYGENILGSLK